MRFSLLFLFFSLLVSCGGGLSDSQREAIKKSMRDGRVQRVSPAALITSGLESGRAIVALLGDDLYLGNRVLMDSISTSKEVKIYMMKSETVQPGTKHAEVWEAYLNAPDPADLKENIQKIGSDSLLYTRPVTYERPDGSLVLSHAVAVVMAVKNVIVYMEE